MSAFADTKSTKLTLPLLPTSTTANTAAAQGYYLMHLCIGDQFSPERSLQENNVLMSKLSQQHCSDRSLGLLQCFDSTIMPKAKKTTCFKLHPRMH